MPAPKILPTSDVLVKLRQQGWTYDDIAAEYGVTKGAVYLALRQAKAVKDRPRYDQLIPWTVKSEHASARPAMMLRLFGRREAGLEIPRPKARMLDKWLAEVREADVVVDYAPDFPPNPASPVTGGWHYRRRIAEDGDGLIRKPEVTEAPSLAQQYSKK